MANVNGLYRNVAQAGMTNGSVASPRTPKFKLPSGVNNGGRNDVPMPAPANKQKQNGVNFAGARGQLSFPARRAIQPQQQPNNMQGQPNMIGNMFGMVGAPGSPMVTPPMVGQPAQVSPSPFMGGFMPMPQGQPGGINPGGNMFPGAPINPIQSAVRQGARIFQSNPQYQPQAQYINPATLNPQQQAQRRQPMRPMPFRGMPQLM